MLEFLRDSIWQFAGVIVTLILGSFIYYLENRKKKLFCTVVVNARLITINGKLKQRFKVLFDGIEVVNCNVVFIKLKNVGNRAIRRSDYDNPDEDRLTFNFGKYSTVLETKIIYASNKALQSTTSQTDFITNSYDKVFLKPILFQKQEEIALQFLVSNPERPILESDIVFEARIPDVKVKQIFTNELSDYVKQPSFIQFAVLMISFCVFNIGFIRLSEILLFTHALAQEKVSTVIRLILMVLIGLCSTLFFAMRLKLYKILPEFPFAPKNKSKAP